MTPGVDPRDLLGDWSFERVVDDHLAGELLHVTGTTTLSAADGGAVRWAEEGVLRRGSLELPVSRVLHLAPGSEGWRVTFEDGRDFHPWEPGEEVVHLCGADTYRGLVELEPGGQAEAWRVTWRVSGPSKDYTMVTRLGRVGPLRPS